MSTDDLVKIIGAIAIVLLFIFIAIAIFRRIGGEVRGKRGSRLAVTEFRELDKLRHLVLVRCDNEEHLLLIGGPQDLVIESNIGRYEESYADEPASTGRMPPPQPRAEPVVAATSEPKLPPPANQEQFEEFSDLPPPLKAPGRR
ncbi:MAG: flagellar biosynthetic protein FliO [Pseudomonadota bacterium]